MEKLLSQRSGSAEIVGSLFATVFTVMAIFIMVITYAAFQTKLETEYEADLIAHRYLIKLETADYSDSAAINLIYDSLEDELEALGMTQIDFGGSTVSEVESGSEIILHVSGKMTHPEVVMPGGGRLAGASLVRTSVSIDITKSGTALY